MALDVGSTLGGRYELVRQLGSGGMGVVWLAKHRELGTQVAIKVLRAEVMSDKESVTRFDREARAAASLRGAHVARILDVGRADDGTPFMVMEFLEGNDLGAEILNGGPLTIANAVDYVQQACDAMVEAHERGIIHRDLKPENLFLARSGESRVVKILDFGISRMAANGETRVTQTQSSFGTPLYMSPEQVRSTKNVDHRTDIWSLGVIFYELVTGEPPFGGETPTAVAVAITIDRLAPLREKRSDIPEALEAVIARALERDPANRFQSMREFHDALEPFRGTESSHVSRVVGPSSSFAFGRGSDGQGASASSKTLRVSNAELPARTGSKRSTPAWLVGAVIGLALACVGAAAFALKKPSASPAAAHGNGPAGSDAPVATATMHVEQAVAVQDAPTGKPAATVDVTPSSLPSAVHALATTTAASPVRQTDSVKTSKPIATAAPAVATAVPVAPPPPPPPRTTNPPLHL